MKAYNLLTHSLESLADYVEVLHPMGCEPRFVTISSHSGHYLPHEMLEIIDIESDLVRREIFQDGDPLLDEFLFQGEGAISVNSFVHRCAGDLNRDPEDLGPNGFLRSHSFHGVPLLKPDAKHTPELIQHIQSWYWEYINTLDGVVKDFVGPLFMAQLHAMDPVSGVSYGQTSGVERPDICLIYGKRGSHLHPELEDVLLKSLQEELPGWSIAINQPFDGIGNAYALLKRYGKPQQGWHACEIEINKKRYLEGKKKDEIAFGVLQRALSNSFLSVLDALDSLGSQNSGAHPLFSS